MALVMIKNSCNGQTILFTDHEKSQRINPIEKKNPNNLEDNKILKHARKKPIKKSPKPKNVIKL